MAPSLTRIRTLRWRPPTFFWAGALAAVGVLGVGVFLLTEGIPPDTGARTIYIGRQVLFPVGSSVRWKGFVGRSNATLVTFTSPGAALSGTIAYEGIEEKLRIELQDDGTVRMAGKTYRRLSGSGQFNLDTFSGSLSPDGTSVQGTYVDAAGNRGQWQFRKETPFPLQSGAQNIELQSYPAGDTNRVPMAIRKRLDEEYPGWSFPQVLAEDVRTCRQSNPDFLPALVWGDFDGDGAQDYAIAIVQNQRHYTLAFLARGSEFTKLTLEPSGWNILGVAQKGHSISEVGKAPQSLANDALIGIHCESSSVAYVYSDGTFQHFFMSD